MNLNNIKKNYGYPLESYYLSTAVKRADYHWLIEQAEKVKKYERIIHAIANIDTMFMDGDGNEREWNDKEALKEIDRLVMPVWEENCENYRGK